MKYNSDGYVLIDMSEVDMSKSNQYVRGMYNRITVECKNTNKLAIVINAGDLTPMAAVINRSLNFYVVTTALYIFKVNTNDIVIIEQAGSSSVEVAIVPTLLEGVKLADFQIGDTIGAIFAPPQESEINDTVASDHTTFSSDKINNLLSGKANSADVYTKSEVDTALSNKANAADVYTKTEVDTTLNSYQPKTDNTLATTSKTVVGAINELNGDISNLYYKVGDTISATIYKEMAGRLTNAGDKVLCFYPTYKYISSNVQSASLVLPSGNAGYIYTYVGGYPLKAGTYAGTITDGGIYFLIDLATAQQTGGIGCTVEMANRTITFS